MVFDRKAYKPVDLTLGTHDSRQLGAGLEVLRHNSNEYHKSTTSVS